VHADPAAAVATPVTLSRKPEPVSGDEPRWEPVYGLHGLVGGRLEIVEIEGQPLVFCRMGKDLYAYLDVCPGCHGTVHDGTLVGEVLRCAGCGASYDVRLAGRSLDGLGLHLDPIPLVNEGGGTVRVAVPAGAVR
jgi:nitrite reductase/ring-hydroxylating ferredoxin subunit